MPKRCNPFKGENTCSCPVAYPPIVRNELRTSFLAFPSQQPPLLRGFLLLLYDLTPQAFLPAGQSAWFKLIGCHVRALKSDTRVHAYSNTSVEPRPGNTSFLEHPTQENLDPLTTFSHGPRFFDRIFFFFRKIWDSFIPCHDFFTKNEMEKWLDKKNITRCNNTPFNL